jgi:putative hydrolase of HD superfamily
MDENEIAGALMFLRKAERLKTVLRSGRTSSGRPESTAEHTWRLCLMALVFAPHLGEMDVMKLLKICVVHDLGEALGGDVPANVQSSKAEKTDRERADLQELVTPLAPAQRDEILSLWDEYEAASSPEARIAKGLDKLETILQHTQGQNQPNVDYTFNLEYGRKQTSVHPVLEGIRRILDEDTRSRRAEQQQVRENKT